jgi:hypothetical protein
LNAGFFSRHLCIFLTAGAVQAFDLHMWHFCFISMKLKDTMSFHNFSWKIKILSEIEIEMKFWLNSKFKFIFYLWKCEPKIKINKKKYSQNTGTDCRRFDFRFLPFRTIITRLMYSSEFVSRKLGPWYL